MRPTRPLALASAAACLLATATTPALAQQPGPVPHGQSRPPGEPLSPAEAVRRMTVPPGFAVEVVAAEPDLVNPVAMTFDERGRIWVAESLEYPRQSAGPGRDRVKVLEDTDGDGKADTFTVFADGLNIPSGLAVGHGGAWVANAPDILFLQDTDGDGTADRREVVVTGFGREDTHELPNALTWGPDGWLYGWNGVFNPAHIVHRGKTFDFTCAVFRIHPKTREFQVWCEGTSNPWGIAFDDKGSAFASACVIDHLWHLAESAYYHRQGGPYPPFTWKAESIVDHKHQQAAYCGIAYFDSDAYPPQYRDKLYMGNIHGNAINVDRVGPRGSTYRAEAEPDFLSAHDAWFMPVAQKVGPDGCLYVLDWYDRYHCYQDANRDPGGIDRLKGRLYRVRYRDTPRAGAFDLAREPVDRLVGRLSSPNLYFRETAQRILAERDDRSARPGLQGLALDATAGRKPRMHALWALIGAGGLDPAFLGKILADPDAVVRAWGVRAAGDTRGLPIEVRAKVESLADDPDPVVALQVAVALRKVGVDEPISALTRMLARCGEDSDPLLPRVIWQNLHPLLDNGAGVSRFSAAVAEAGSIESPSVLWIVPRVIERALGSPDPTHDGIVRLLDLVARIEKPDGEAVREILSTLARSIQAGAASPSEKAKLREGLKPALARLIAKPASAEYALDAALLSAAWGDPEALQFARDAFLDGRRGEDERLRALDTLIAHKGASPLDDVARTLVEAGRGSSAFRGKLLAALGKLDEGKVAEVVLAGYPRIEPDLRPRAVELLTQRAAWSRALLDAIGRKEVPSAALDANQIRRLASSKDDDVAASVKAIFGSIREGRNPAREQVILQMRTFLRSNPGDPHAGRAVFARVCGQCHRIYGEGQEVGPEVTANGRGSYEQLLSNVFDPSLVIGSSYQGTTVATADGRVLSGLVVEDGPGRVVLKLQGGKLEVIPRAEVEAVKKSELSLMPEGIEGQMTPKELSDLFAFLSLDKPPGDPAARPIPGAP